MALNRFTDTAKITKRIKSPEILNLKPEAENGIEAMYTPVAQICHVGEYKTSGKYLLKG